ncbi:MAG TPA: thermonuclease family protein [Pyrinomonadaceae bacterium]
MKHSRLIFLIIFTLIFSVSVFAQHKFSGTVVDIVDGKTVVLEMQAGSRITVELQYIEVPEPEQQLHQTVREHLQRMIYGRQVEFLPRGIAETKTIGQLSVGGVDVSQQMLRDGAAWHVSPEKSGQDEAQRELYQSNEALAKAEKRGVWSIENLQPAWEFRARSQEVRQQQPTAEPEKVESQNQTVSTSRRRRWTVEEQLKANASNVQMWNDARSAKATEASSGGASSLLSNYFSSARIGYTSTPSTFINVAAGNSQVKLDHRAFYFYRGDKSSGVEKDVFALGFLTVSPGARFATSNNLTIIADKQKFAFVKTDRLHRQFPEGYVEILFYKVSPAVLKKIADAKSAQIKVGQYSGAIGDETQAAMNELLTATN